MSRKKILSCILSAAMLGTGNVVPISSSAAHAAEPVQIYVSPDGDDANTGSNDAPFRTLERAQEEVRKYNSDMDGDITVNIAPGMYFMDNTLSLTTEDSGNNGYKVIYRGIPNDDGSKPVISGGINISDGWELYDEGNNIYKRENVDWQFRQLYTNNDRAIRARVPNLEEPETGGPYLRAERGSYPMKIGRNNEYAEKAGKYGEIIWGASWSQFRARIESYDSASGTVTFKSPENSFAWNHHAEGDAPYYLENSLDYLDAEGEWYLDVDENVLYYKPREGEIMNETEIIAPKLETIVDIRGGGIDDRVKDICFDNIRFLHSNWLAPNEYGYCSVQGGFRYQSEGGKDNSAIRGSARYDAPKSMVQLRYTDGIELTNSEFSFSGSWGIMGYEGTQNTLIDHNTFVKNAGGGVTMGMAGREWDDQTEDEKPREYTDMDGQSVGDTITNNLIDHVACEYQDMVGIGAMLPQHMTIANNEIGYLPYTGINIGWNWLDTDHGMTANKVYQNYIHNTCMLLQDGGGIYSLGRMNGDSNFYYNYITDTVRGQWACHNNIMGIYFDNGSCYKKAQANVFDNTEYSFQASNPPNHDNIFEGNYYNCPGGMSSTGSSANISNRPFTSDAIPDEALNIIDHAGIDKDPLPDPSSRVNIAFRKPITSSETDDAQPAKNATDGDPSTMWEQYMENRPDEAKAQTSLTVDLEDSYSVDEIMITFQYGNRSRYKIEYSNDGNDWKEYANKLNIDPSPSESVYEAKSGVTARYLKLTMNTGGWGAGVKEIYVYSNDENVPASAEISPENAVYDKSPAWKQEIKLTALENGSSVTGLRNGSYELVPDVDYEKHWGNVILKTSYLDTLPNGENEITVEFDKSEAKTLTVTVEEDDGTSNIALNKPIEASSYNTDENRYAKYMVDGDSGTRWAQKQGTASETATIILDLQDTYLVKRTSIDFELDSAGYNYKIEYSTNGDVWRTFVDNMNKATTTRTVIDSGEAVARYLKLTVQNKDWGASIWELQVKGSPYTVEEDLQNLALNKPITATSHNTNEAQREPKYMVDGDSNTRWAQASGTNGTHNTIDVDLGKVYDVRSVVINWELPYGNYNYKIEYSEDGENYSTYVDKLSVGTTTQITEDTKKVNARYFRLEVNHNDWGASIWELQILGIDSTIQSGELTEGVYTLSDNFGRYITAGESIPIASTDIDGGYNEKWIVVDEDGTYFRLINALSGEALAYSNTDSRDAVTAPVSVGDSKQLWQWVKNTDGNGSSMLMNKDCGLMLQINGGETSSNGAPLGLYWYEGWVRKHYSWKVEEQKDGTIMLLNDCGTYLRADGSGANAQTWEKTKGDAQKWEITKTGDAYTITSTISGKRLALNNGILVMAAADDNDANQKWTVQKSGDLLTKSCIFTNVASGETLNIEGASTWKYVQDEKSEGLRPYITDITTTGIDTITVNYNYHFASAEGETSYKVYALDSRSAASGTEIASGPGRSGFTFDASKVDSSKVLLIAVTPKDVNGTAGAEYLKYIYPALTAESLTQSIALEESFDGIFDTVNNNQKGWSHSGAGDVLLDNKDGHTSALGFKGSGWFGESQLSLDFSNSGNDYTVLSDKAYVEYDMYFDSVDNHDRESQAAIGLKSNNNMFGTIQQRGDQLTLAAGGGNNIAKLYSLGDKNDIIHHWVNVKYFIDTNNNKFAVALDDKFMTSDDGTIWFTPTGYTVPHNEGSIKVDKVTGLAFNNWWQSDGTAIYIDNLKTGIYSDNGFDPWSVYAVEPAGGKLNYGAENTVSISIKENTPVENGIVYVGLYKENRLCSAALNNSITFDSRGVNTNTYKINIPKEAGAYTLKIFMWDKDQKPIARAYTKSYAVESPFSMTNVFGDNMVLQADQPIKLWGYGYPGDTVTASIESNSAAAAVNSNGEWELTLAAMDAGTGHKLTVTNGSETLNYNNVALGDVFILAGQSNMEFWMSGFADSLADLEADKASGRVNNSNIRIVELLNLDRNYEATEPRENLPEKAVWGEMNADRGWLASQIGYYLAQQLNEETGRPIGLISGAVGGSDVTRWQKNGDLYNNRIYPCRKLNIAAILFYQGEAEDKIRDAANYSDVLAELIDDYREVYDRPDLPFYYAQLPRLSTQHFEHIRSAQIWALNKVASKNNIGVISTLDEVGNLEGASGRARYDVHPYGKKEIASRFARYIKHDIYGDTSVTAHGPIYQSMEVKGNTIELTFDCTGALKVLPKDKYADPETPSTLDFNSLYEFEIAGADGVYKNAKAELSGNKVILSNPTISEPKNARYAYSAYPEAPNLTDESGLPSYTFCTEHF
ncbi:MAG: discoidin domain-containing protein [bacterium]|nr:discoidin domain-containing protein [bacterium]